MADQEIVEEGYFLELFRHVLERRNGGRASDDEINESIQKFVDYFRINRKPACACAGDRFLSQPDYLGYFYWHSPLSTAVTRNKAQAAIRNCKEFRSCFHRRLLNVVSVGGGTGSDLVGLYSAILADADFQDMNVLLIDNISEWNLYVDEIDGLLRLGDFGNASQLIKNRNINTGFITVDITNELNPESKKALNEADLVWMKGFLSTLANDDERRDVTGEIISSMTPGALLVVMESLAYDQFHSFIEKNKLRRLYSTSGRYKLEIASELSYRIMNSTNQEIIIFERI